MRKGNIILWMTLLGMVGVSCSDGDDVATTPPEKVLTCDFIFSIRQPGGMRMANEVVQTEESMFRGLQNVQVIPFATAEAAAVAVDDVPQMKTTLFTNENKVTDKYYYYTADCQIADGTNRMLAYGQAAPVTGKELVKENGKLVHNLENVIQDNLTPSAINFQLQEIHGSTEVTDDGAQELANYLTNIAKTLGWSTTADAELKQLYRDFIRAGKESTGLLAGSTASVKGHVEALEAALSEKSDALSTAIKANITAGESVLTAPAPDYPANIGLPDGAAALRWTGEGLGNQFSVRTTWTTLDNINSINRFTYPAELWYYVNSAIMTSNQTVGRENYKSAATWDGLLSSHYKDGTAVDYQTKSIAVTDPLQYGVGRLQLTLKAITGTLKDSKNNVVTDGTAANLPLKGIIVTGQHPVGFDFKPKTPKDDVNTRFIYDPVVGTTGTGADETVNTLVLQSYDGEKVYVVLEMQNNTGHAFHGKDAVIYSGSKFYLIAEIDPAGQGTGDCAGRVFTQDYYTKVDVTVNSLAKAYSCIPDLLEPRLEIGVQVVTQWIQSTTTTVKL